MGAATPRGVAARFRRGGSVEISPTLFEIDLAGGRRVRVPMRFDPDALRTLVSVLDAAC